MVDHLEALQLVGPLLAGILTEPLLALIFRLAGVLKRLPNWGKQLAGLAVAYGLTVAGQWLNVALPTELALFTGNDVEALISAVIAYGIADRKRAKAEQSPPAKLLLVAALLLLRPGGLAAQARDSVTVTIVDRGAYAAVITTDSARLRGAPGDTVTFEAIVVDTLSGDTWTGDGDIY